MREAKRERERERGGSEREKEIEQAKIGKEQEGVIVEVRQGSSEKERNGPRRKRQKKDT